MKIDALFSNALVFDIQSRIDELQCQLFTLITDVSEGFEVFSNNDKVLSLEHTATDVVITASEIGESTIRFMTDETTTRKVLIRVVSEFVRPATDLGIGFEQPENK